MLVFRRITSADFFNIYKEPGTEAGGGGQSYIDVDTSGVSLAAWGEFFSGISPKPMKGGPLWTFEVNSLGVGEKQNLKIGQRRATSVSIREQKLVSHRSNRIFAWNPSKTGFPSPKSSIASSADPQIAPLIEGLVIFLIRATDGSYWAGWMRVQDRPTSWTVPSILETMFKDGDGVVEFTLPINFDESSLHWPFHLSGHDARFRDMTEEEAASALFDADYSDEAPSLKEVATKVRQRNQKAVRALKELYGECQISGSKYVFEKADGKPYLEVHHLVPLGLGGADAPSNLIVVSAHMHRMLHYAVVSGIYLTKITDNQLRIKINGRSHVIKWRPEHGATILKSK